MRESMAFENVALDVFNLIDLVVESFEKVDQAIWSLEQAGKAHAKVNGFKVQYFAVSIRRILPSPVGLVRRNTSYRHL